MTEETEISTPVENSVEETSETIEPANNADTSIAEPDSDNITAETETGVNEGVNEGANTGKNPDNNPQGTLYAGKYTSVEELEKGYTELQKLISKPNEFEQKYNELLKVQQEAEEKAQQEKLRIANEYGYRTVEDQEAAEKIKAAELEWYANNLDLVSPEQYENARSCLADYLRTGHKDYLNAAKKFFPIDFVEQVTNAKTEFNARLQSEIAQKRELERSEQEKNLAQLIKTEYAEFLSDCATNEPKSKALKAMCDAGVINSKEDMQSFVELYTSIFDSAKEAAIKEYEAQKVIESEKQKAVINTGSGALLSNGGLKDSYTPQEIGAMSQAEYDALCDKYGELEITKRIIGD